MVRETEQSRAAEDKGHLIAIPTGDGMALVSITVRQRPWNARSNSAVPAAGTERSAIFIPLFLLVQPIGFYQCDPSGVAHPAHDRGIEAR